MIDPNVAVKAGEDRDDLLRENAKLRAELDRTTKAWAEAADERDRNKGKLDAVLVQASEARKLLQEFVDRCPLANASKTLLKVQEDAEVFLALFAETRKCGDPPGRCYCGGCVM